jgi:hypothetical protein
MTLFPTLPSHRLTSRALFLPVLFLLVPPALSAGCRSEDALGVPPAVCSTQAVGNVGESAMMEPGGDCIGCHSAGEGPSYTVAGTVMAAFRDDTNCTGLDAITVRLTGADGRQVDLQTNAAGNFFARLAPGLLAFPYHAEVIHGTVSVPMIAARTASETSCNTCHTAAGANGAPGRIVAP